MNEITMIITYIFSSHSWDPETRTSFNPGLVCNDDDTMSGEMAMVK